jgi:hypothetical protein
VLFVDMAGGARTIKVALHLLQNGVDRDHALDAPTRRDSNADHFGCSQPRISQPAHDSSSILANIFN